jgi:hypothetical protein
MANDRLFRSGALALLVHLAGFWAHQPPPAHIAFITAGCLTTLWNHGTTTEAAKWGDRLMMAACVLYHLRYEPRLIVLWTAVPAYFAAKITGDDRWHLVSHACATWGNLNAMAAITDQNALTG